MSVSAFNHVEAGITIADRPTTAADIRALHHPAGFESALSRVILHETVHLWQYLSSGYLAGLAAEDWHRLKSFEHDGKVTSAGQKRRTFIATSEKLQFSPKDLHESLARFWDMHILGPPLLIELELASPTRSIPEEFVREYREAEKAGLIRHPEHGGYSDLSFRMAMRCAAGNYGRPYLWLLNLAGVPLADILFPLCGFFAFQTPDPIRAFNLLVRHGSYEFSDVVPNRPIHDWWRKGYWRVGQLAVRVAEQLGADGLEHIGKKVTDGELADHPVWPVLFELRRCAGIRFRDLPLFDVFPDADPDRLAQGHGLLNLDYALACPGDPDYRGMLVQCLAPASVRFGDETVWNLGALAATQDRHLPFYKVQCALEGEIQQLRLRWERFLYAKFRY